MDIFVKSFNRPYYLDRCLRSIEQFVTGDYQVQVLDDGTPPEYLARIQERYPTVRVVQSPRYAAKVAALRRHVAGEAAFDERVVPFDFWIEQVRACSDVFLLIEDDIWLTEPLDVAAFAEQMQVQRLAIVKLSWLGNDMLNGGRRKVLPPAGGTALQEMLPPTFRGPRRACCSTAGGSARCSTARGCSAFSNPTWSTSCRCIRST